ncbi:peptidyl-prolyl cis-trans isomerase [Neisseria sp.]|uniref:peptidylprolyl isomerase n=1 Tax=Neisseria sp. TaxID=192066 RepID=UPI00359F9001
MNKTRLAAAFALAALSGSLAAKTIVTVNGTAVDSKAIDAQVKALQSHNRQIKDSPALRQDLTNRYIVGTVVAQEARRLKLHESADYKNILNQSLAAAKQQGADKKSGFQTEWAAYETDLLNQAYIAHIIRSNPVKEADVKSAYADFAKFYQGSQEVQLGAIITRKREDAQKAVDELKAKKDFKTVAAKYTIDPAGKKAGGIPSDYVRLKDMEQAAPALYSAVKNLPEGGYTAPLQDNGIFGVFYVNDKRAVQLPGYDAAKNGLRQELQAGRIDRAIQSLLQKAVIRPAK